MFETMTSAFIDEFPTLLRKRKVLFTAFLCFIEFLLGIPCIMQGGIYVLQIMDWYCAVFSMMLLSLTECVVIGWIYGADRFYKDIELMIGYQPCLWWKICWMVITPVTIICIWLFSVTQLSPVTYGDYKYPDVAIAIGWMLGLVSLLPVPLCALIAILGEQGSLIERIKKLVHHSDDWGPAVEKHRARYLQSLEDSSPHVYLDSVVCTPLVESKDNAASQLS